MPPWLRYAIVLTGLALIIYEAVIYRGEPRYWLLVVYTAMVGLPSLFALDQDDKAPPAPPAPDAPKAPKRPRRPKANDEAAS